LKSRTFSGEPDCVEVLEMVSAPVEVQVQDSVLVQAVGLEVEVVEAQVSVQDSVPVRAAV